MTESRGGPLQGVTVLDLGTMVAGPVAATLMADFGATVIKVEQPTGGDTLRGNGPAVDGEGLWWNIEGRNKQSLTLDLRQAEGQQILRDLAVHADVLVENFRPGTMERWSIGYDRLRQANPRLVMLSISGYGQTGPKAPQPAYDRIALAFSGHLHMTGFKDRPPLRPGTAMADYQTAVFGAFSTMAALYHRDAQGGTGQHIDLSLFETMFRFTDVMVTAYDKLGLPRERNGNLHFAAAPGQHFETQDGRYLVITISNNGLFRRLCAAMEQPDLADEQRFSTHAMRWENIEAINAAVGVWIKSQPVDEINAALAEHGVPNALVYSAADILADPHYAAREAISTIHNPRIGALKMPASPGRFSGTPTTEPKVAPELGGQSTAILTGLLGLSPERIAALARQGVV